MKRKLLRVLILSISVLSLLGVVVGCDNFPDDNFPDDIYTDRLSIMIKAEYKEKFLAHEFSVEDFRWANVERIEHKWYFEETEKGELTVYLKKHSKKRIQDVKKHFEKLDFVDRVSYKAPYSEDYNNKNRRRVDIIL